MNISKELLLTVVLSVSQIGQAQQTLSTPVSQSNCGGQTGDHLSKHVRLSSKTKGKIARWLHDKGIADIDPNDLDPGQIAKSTPKPCPAAPLVPTTPQVQADPLSSKH